MGSAGEHEWREVTIHVFPTVTGARFAVLTKKKRGARTVWQRTLCVYEVVEADSETMETLAGVLSGCAHVLRAAADKARQQAPGSA